MRSCWPRELVGNGVVQYDVAAVGAVGGLRQPGAGDQADLALLAPVDLLQRPARARPPRLDLDEHDPLVVAGHEVELAEPGAVVADEDAVAEPFEVLGGEPLPEAADGLARGGHGTRT